ncbi:MAG: polysaccharide biosynthesis/export family protein [Gammaproteobacteria bacterium]|nr:polysaccharide biosynthesis/export family protein [Gammaproteobacteria bacterium]
MNRLITVFLFLLSMGCSTPGQHFGVSKWVYEKPSSVDQAEYEIVRLSPDLLGSLSVDRQSTFSGNPALEQRLRDYRYIVGPNDILSFTVWDHPELTIPAGAFRSPEIQGHLVSSSGEVFFPYVGKVHVSGMDLVEIRRDVTQRLSRYIQNPQLDVRVASFRSQKVNVVGQVKQPGFFPITDIPMTLVDAIDFAGGASDLGALQQVQVLRNGEVRFFDVLALLQRADMQQNLLLESGDVVYVPENSFFAVHMLGGVIEPGSILMSSGRLNLAEAITRSGGFNDEVSNPEKVFVFRNGKEKPAVYWLDAKSPDAMLLATRFELQPQDVVFVAQTGLARWNRVVNLVLPTIQTLWQTQSFIDRLND